MKTKPMKKPDTKRLLAISSELHQRVKTEASKRGMKLYAFTEQALKDALSK